MQSARPRHENGFDAVRLVAAATVVVTHAWSLTGRDGTPLIGGRPAFDVAVWVFFSLSGFLVATSWNRSPSAGGFLLRRAARIFPALAVVVLVTVLVVGPLVTVLPVREYLAAPATWAYLTNVTLIASYELPGVFVDAARPGVVNGVFWSLGPEFACYLVVLVLGLAIVRIGRSSRSGRAAAFLLVGAALAAVTVAFPAALGGFEPATEAAVFFMVGAAIAQLSPSGRLPVLPAVVGVGVWLALGFVSEPIATGVAWLVLPYAVLSIGARSTPFVRRAGRFGDPSYGIYLWGFPIQQILATTMPDLPLVAVIALSLAGALCLGYASWHLVERPVLMLARRSSASLERASAPTSDPADGRTSAGTARAS